MADFASVDAFISLPNMRYSGVSVNVSKTTSMRHVKLWGHRITFVLPGEDRNRLSLLNVAVTQTLSIDLLLNLSIMFVSNSKMYLKGVYNFIIS